jgi:hypothetical protein
MRIQVIKKGTSTAKPIAYCDTFVDDPPPMAKKN